MKGNTGDLAMARRFASHFFPFFSSLKAPDNIHAPTMFYLILAFLEKQNQFIKKKHSTKPYNLNFAPQAPSPKPTGGSRAQHGWRQRPSPPAHRASHARTRRRRGRDRRPFSRSVRRRRGGGRREEQCGLQLTNPLLLRQELLHVEERGDVCRGGVPGLVALCSITARPRLCVVGG